jgi:hypothetical protein
VSGELVAQYESMTSAQRQKVALAEYQCGQGCRLLTIWQSPAGRCWYTPAYKLTETVALAETVDMARAKRTKDGLRRWRARAGSLDEIITFGADGSDAVGLSLNCRHLRNHFVSWQELAADTDYVTTGAPKWFRVPRGAEV